MSQENPSLDVTRETSDPSAFIEKMLPHTRNKMREPSGDHEGRTESGTTGDFMPTSVGGGSVYRVVIWPPCDPVVSISAPPRCRSRTKIRLFPSVDHDGSLPAVS